MSVTDRKGRIWLAVAAGLLLAILANGVWMLPGLSREITIHAMALEPGGGWFTSIVLAARFCIYVVIALPPALMLQREPFRMIFLSAAIATLSIPLWTVFVLGGWVTNVLAVRSVAIEGLTVGSALLLALGAVVFLRRRLFS